MLVVLIAGTLNSIGLLALGIGARHFLRFSIGDPDDDPLHRYRYRSSLATLLAIVTKGQPLYAVGVIGVTLLFNSLKQISSLQNYRLQNQDQRLGRHWSRC